MSEQESAYRVKPSDAQVMAIELLKALLAESDWRRAFVDAEGTDAKRAVFDARRDDDSTEDRLRAVNYDELAGPARELLERLSDSELALLADVDAAFVDAGLVVSTNPFPLMIY